MDEYTETRDVFFVFIKYNLTFTFLYIRNSFYFSFQKIEIVWRTS